MATAPYTRAILKIGRTLILGKYYAFQINIKSPEFWNMSQHDGWRLWLQSPDGYMVDGSKYSVQFNSARVDTLPVEPHDRGWAVYPSGLLLPVNFSLGAERILPTSAFDMSAFLSVYPLTPSTDGQLTSLRLIAPVGFVWIPFAEQGWQGYLPNFTCKYCELQVTPEVQFQNELLLRNLVMRSTMFYGFRVRMWVPLRPPSRSTNAFYLEIGYDPGKDADYYLDRMQGAMLPAPPIRVVHDVFIYSRCNLAGFNDNIMDFRLRIASPLTVNDGFLIEGNELTRGTMLGCWPSSIPELLSITSVEGNCLVFENAVTLLPVVKIWITQSLQMPPGLYGFRFRGVTMPSLPTSAMLYWKMGTYSQLHLYPKHEILDVAVDIPSPQVLGFLPEAGILRPNFYAAPGFGRDDAPLKLNILAFYFRISKTPLFAEDMESFVVALRGPLGFFFEEDCSQYLRAFMEPTDGQSRLPCAANSRVSWCPSAVLMSWPSRLAPVACLGINETARISVPNSAFVEAQQGGHVAVFQPNGVYGFEVQVQNPEIQPLDNLWALDFGNEASKPFASIRIQSFVPEETKLEMACSVSSQFWWPNLEKYLPFRIDFVPHTTIPAPRMLERRLQSGSDPLLPQAEDGSVVVFSPPNFDFPVADFDMCVNSVLEVQGRQPWDFVALFASGADVVCRVGDVLGLPSTEGGGPERRSMVFLLIHRKAMFQGVAYTLEGLVRNPSTATWPRAMTWRMESYTRFIATGERVRLDEYFLEGPAIRSPAKDFQVSNSAAEYYGGVIVHVVDISVVLPAPLMTGQSIEIKAPRGFEMGANSSNQSCLNFRWPGTFRPLRLDALGTCSCSVIHGEVSCRVLMNVSYVPSEPGEAVLTEGDTLSFRISVLNPTTPREALRNLWEMTHWDVVQNARPLSSAFAESWPIYSELANFSIWISGTRKRAGALSDLSLSFIPVAWGSVLEINIHDPPGYDFSDTRPGSPLAKEITSKGSRMVVVNGDFRPGILQMVFLGEVILGSPGGRTRISIQMFTDFRMQNEVARKINFLNGFVQPGSVTIFSQQLLNQAVVSHYEGGTFDSVLPLLPCFAQQLARVEFFFRLSCFISTGSSFILKNLGTDGNNHEFYLESGFEPVIELCHGQDQGRNGSSTQWLCNEVVRVNYTQKQYTRNNFELVNGFRAVLERMGQEYITDAAAVNELAYLTDGLSSMALEANRDYRVRFWVLPTMMATEWYVATEHETGYLTNTNDGETSAPTAVPQMSLTVTPEVSRSPPVSATTVSISVRAAQGQWPFSRLLLLPPYGFLPYGAQIPEGTGRPMLELDMIVANPLIDEMTYQLRMHTPRRTNLDPRWFVLARNLQVDEITGEISDRIVGWSFVDGFGVAPCAVTARYGAIPSYTGWLALTFKVPALAKGRFALFSAPESFELRCPDIKEAGQACEPYQIEEHFPDELLALPIARTLNLTMGTFIAEGQDLVYSAMLIIVTPEALLTLQPWELRVLDQSFTVVDAHLEIPSLPFSELQAENPTVKWLTMPQRGEAAMVAIQVIINRRIKTLRMLVFLMPEGFRHDIQHANQLANINKNFPVAIEREWRDFSNLRSVRIFIEPTTVASGTFEWQFPVIVAQKAPINTEWYVFLCDDYSCRVFSDPSVVVVFPVPDFHEKIPAVTFDGLMMTGGLQRRHLAKWSLILLLGGLMCSV
ncbi:unnamed protein product [Cladocopium goreaui]|uniref:Uncharacterized protein n=1 Tax=Cladocopium goreaui TaxID=2562237 RepID=A0A9P1FN72_9DINO|nr:unnamed protein product [Cladocopium goreaui]